MECERSSRARDRRVPQVDRRQPLGRRLLRRPASHDHVLEPGCRAHQRLRADEVTGHRCFEEILRHVDERGRRLCHSPCPLIKTMATGRPQESRIYVHHKDGHRVPVYVRTAPIRDPDGTVVGAVEIVDDDTRMEDARAELDELRRLSMIDPSPSCANGGRSSSPCARVCWTRSSTIGRSGCCSPISTASRR